MCKPTTLLHATLYVLFFVCIVGLRIYNLLITYDDDDQGRRHAAFCEREAKEGPTFFRGHPSSICTHSFCSILA